MILLGVLTSTRLLKIYISRLLILYSFCIRRNWLMSAWLSHPAAGGLFWTYICVALSLFRGALGSSQEPALTVYCVFINVFFVYIYFNLFQFILFYFLYIHVYFIFHYKYFIFILFIFFIFFLSKEKARSRWKNKYIFIFIFI